MCADAPRARSILPACVCCCDCDQAFSKTHDGRAQRGVLWHIESSLRKLERSYVYMITEVFGVVIQCSFNTSMTILSTCCVRLAQVREVTHLVNN